MWKYMNNVNISYEFFPPRTQSQIRKFWCTLGCLQTLNPAYISMTWGALGTDSQASLDILEQLANDSITPITAHLSCAGQTETAMRATIEMLEKLGITRFLALRGDPQGNTRGEEHEPSLQSNRNTPLLSNASDLVALLASDSGRDITVAAYPEAHPESASAQSDLKWLKYKLDAGASQAITQFFFEADTFLRFRDNARTAGITEPLIPGILPIHDIQKVLGFSQKCGASVSSSVVAQFEGATTAESRNAAAVEQCVSMCETLIAEGVDEFHLYTLNQAPLAYAVSAELLGLSDRRHVQSTPQGIGVAA